MSHIETYRHNESYADFLSSWNLNFHDKYIDFLSPATPGRRVLDVGCGVGRVVNRLDERGFEAYGVDVSKPNIERARRERGRYRLYDGGTLPFPDRHFAAAGAFNVLEHVEAPERFIAELVRVTSPRGRIVLSSPNFFRVLGLRDYHPHMRGVRNKWRNWRRVREKCRQMHAAPASVRFDRMAPIAARAFKPDNDAIVATNPFEMMFFLSRHGCRIEQSLCTDRYVARPVDFMLNCTRMRFYMFNAFIVATRMAV